MTISRSEKALDEIIQQTWKRMRSPQEIRSFLDRREAALSVFDEEFEF